MKFWQSPNGVILNLYHIVAIQIVGKDVEVILSVHGATVTFSAEDASSLFDVMGLS